MITIKIDNENVLNALDRLSKASANPRPAKLAIGESLVESTKKRFDTSTAPDGTPWAPNSAATLKRKRGTKPLIGEGTLRDEIAYAENGDDLIIFSPMIYAGTQHFGADKGQYGNTRRKQPIPFGDIPARPILGISSDDEDMIIETISDYLRSVI